MINFKKYQPRDNHGKYRTYTILIKIFKSVLSLWKS